MKKNDSFQSLIIIGLCVLAGCIFNSVFALVLAVFVTLVWLVFVAGDLSAARRKANIAEDALNIFIRFHEQNVLQNYQNKITEQIGKNVLEDKDIAGLKLLDEKIARILKEKSSGQCVDLNENETAEEFDGKMKRPLPKMMRPGNFDKRLK